MEATFGDNANNIIYREAAVEFFFFLSIIPQGWAANKSIKVFVRIPNSWMQITDRVERNILFGRQKMKKANVDKTNIVVRLLK